MEDLKKAGKFVKFVGRGGSGGRLRLPKVEHHRIIVVRKIPMNIVALRARFNDAPDICLPCQFVHRHGTKVS